jgi:hypothetical protein
MKYESQYYFNSPDRIPWIQPVKLNLKPHRFTKSIRFYFNFLRRYN